MYFDYYVKILRKRFLKRFGESLKLGKLCECSAAFCSTKTRFSLDKKHEKVVASLLCSLYLTESI